MYWQDALDDASCGGTQSVNSEDDDGLPSPNENLEMLGDDGEDESAEQMDAEEDQPDILSQVLSVSDTSRLNNSPQIMVIPSICYCCSL